MRCVVGGHRDRHFKPIRIPRFRQKRFCLLQVGGVIVRQRLVVVFAEGREHAGTKGNPVPVKRQVNHRLLVHRPAQCLPYADIVKRLFLVVEVERLNQIHAALCDAELIMIQLHGLVTAQMRYQIQCAALQSQNQTVRAFQNLERDFVQFAGCAPVVFKALQHQAVLHGSGDEAIGPRAHRCGLLPVIIRRDNVCVHHRGKKLVARL